MTSYGYMRVSTDKQDTALQLDALIERGVLERNIFSDVMSGSRDDRQGLADAIAMIQPGDKLVVWRIDRLSRSLRHLLNVAEEIHAHGGALVSLCEGIDLSTPAGRLVFGMLGAVAQFERDVIRERTKAGLKAAKDRGVKLGRQPELPEGSDRWTRCRDLLLRRWPGRMIARDLGISEATIYKAFPGGRKALMASMEDAA
jgi:DNA invertase Pin-like site-specific DNA recombinase